MPTPPPPLGGGSGGTVPLNPQFGTIVQVTPGLASALTGKVNGYSGSIETNVRFAQVFLEQYAAAHQQGAVSGGSITADTGLAVTIKPYEAVVGNYLSSAGTATIGALSASGTNFLFLRQDGTVTANTSGAVPGTADGHGTALLWGKAVTDGTSVTSVDNNRRVFQKQSGRQVVNLAGLTAYYATVAEAVNPIIEGTGVVTGTVNVILPMADGMGWWIYNNTSGATVGVSAGTAAGTSFVGVGIGLGKRARVGCDGSAFYRMTADV